MSSIECRTREKKNGGTYKICYKPDEKRKKTGEKRKKKKLIRKPEADATRAKASDFLGSIESSGVRDRVISTINTAPRYGINGKYPDNYSDNLQKAIGINRKEFSFDPKPI